MKFIETIHAASFEWLLEKMGIWAAKSSINGAQLVMKHSIEWI